MERTEMINDDTIIDKAIEDLSLHIKKNQPVTEEIAKMKAMAILIRRMTTNLVIAHMTR